MHHALLQRILCSARTLSGVHRALEISPCFAEGACSLFAAHACAGQQRLQEGHICLHKFRHGRHCYLPYPSCMHARHDPCQLGSDCLSRAMADSLAQVFVWAHARTCQMSPGACLAYEQHSKLARLPDGHPPGQLFHACKHQADARLRSQPLPHAVAMQLVSKLLGGQHWLPQRQCHKGRLHRVCLLPPAQPSRPTPAPHVRHQSWTPPTTPLSWGGNQSACSTACM